MKLRSRVLARIAVLFVGVLASLAFALSHILGATFAKVEQQEVAENTDRVLRALAAELRATDTLAGDWAAWDDTVDYIRHRGRRFETANLVPAGVASLQQEVLAIADTQGNIVFGAFIDPSSRRTRPLSQAFARHLKPGGALGGLKAAGERAAGFLVSDGDVWLVSCRPVTNSLRTGPVRGALTMGVRIDADDLARLDKSGGLRVALRLTSAPGVRPEGAVMTRAERDSADVYVQTQNAKEAVGFAPITDVYGRDSLMLEVRSRRTVNRDGVLSLRYTLGSAAFAVGLFAVLVLLLLDRVVIRRLTRLAFDLGRIRASGNTFGRVRMDGDDELGRLADNINTVLADLERSHLIQTQMSLNATDVLLVIDGDTLNCQWHGQSAALLGCAPDAMPTTAGGLLDIIHADDAAQITEMYDRACETGEPFRTECRYVRVDGSYGICAVRGRAMRTPDGRLDRFLIACSDVTERRRHDEELRASQERLSRIVETNANGTLILDVEGRIQFANLAAESILGMSRDELRGHRLDDPLWEPRSLDGEPLAPDDLPDRVVLRTDEPVTGVEMVLTHPTGKETITSVNAAPLHGDKGTAVGVVMAVSDITMSRRLEERLSFQAFHDALTGLPNRALLLDRLGKALQRAERRSNRLAVLFLDVDNFKGINDAHGHPVGDQLLIAVAHRLDHCLRQGDTAARFGGDEFTILAEDLASPEAARDIAIRVITQMQRPFTIGSRELSISVSIGVALNRLGESDPEDLLRNADAAMYEAKRLGRNRCEVFHVGMSDDAQQRKEIESDLRNALTNGEFRLFFQPEINLSDGSIAGMEALLRWSHPERGLMSPGDFIPTAEQTDTIIPIGAWVLREACRIARNWHQLYPLCGWSVAVNLSARQFEQPDLTEAVERALRESGLPPRYLVLEISESAIMAEAEASLERLRGLKRLGARLGIDDFGTGYSSLSYLKRFPIDFVKIDRSFVSGLDRVEDDRAIVSATVSLAHAMGMKIIAEGAENSEQVNRLRHLGCDMAQGYWFARPCPADDIERAFGPGGVGRLTMAGGLDPL